MDFNSSKLKECLQTDAKMHGKSILDYNFIGNESFMIKSSI